MKKNLCFVAVSLFLLSCTNTDRDNPNDMWGSNYIGKSSAEGSSSSVETGEPSSSSEESPPSNSSVEPSSSSEAESSSSEESLPSSSSVEPSSSSVEPSSSSEEGFSSSSSIAPSSSSALPSSSSVAPSSSSVVSSSSSVPPSSSSVAPSSSSVAPSSSSAPPSSSSVALSSSSSNVGCADFTNGTKRLHYEIEKEQFCDERDGKKYVYVKIDTQTWMAENLNYNPSTGNSACYSNNTNNCTDYGRLYDWLTAMGFESSCYSSTCSSWIQSPHRGICPTGWHLPSRAEWEVLGNDAKKLKATSGWNDYNGASGNGTDDYGFSALPGGRGNSDGSFVIVGNYGAWWSASEDGSYNAYYRSMNYGLDDASWIYYRKSYLYSVRCLQD